MSDKPKRSFYALNLNLPSEQRCSNIRFGITSGGSIEGRLIYSRVSYLRKLQELRKCANVKEHLYRQLFELEKAIDCSLEDWLKSPRNYVFIKFQFEQTAKVIEKFFITFAKDVEPDSHSVNFMEGHFVSYENDKRIFALRALSKTNPRQPFEILQSVLGLVVNSRANTLDEQSEVDFYLSLIEKEMSNTKMGKVTPVVMDVKISDLEDRQAVCIESKATEDIIVDRFGNVHRRKHEQCVDGKRVKRAALAIGSICEVKRLNSKHIEATNGQVSAAKKLLQTKQTVQVPAHSVFAKRQQPAGSIEELLVKLKARAEALQEIEQLQAEIERRETALGITTKYE